MEVSFLSTITSTMTVGFSYFKNHWLRTGQLYRSWTGFPPLIDFSTIDRVRLAELVIDTPQGEKHDGHRSKQIEQLS